MCGIVGFIDSRKKKEKDIIIKEMADKIIHRGPDGEGYYTDDVVALGHRRLSIIDVDGGAQPIISKDKSKMIIFNGEIYNYEILKTELSQKGYKFATKTDTEVILCGYEEWGSEITNIISEVCLLLLYMIKRKKNYLAQETILV